MRNVRKSDKQKRFMLSFMAIFNLPNFRQEHKIHTSLTKVFVCAIKNIYFKDSNLEDC